MMLVAVANGLALGIFGEGAVSNALLESFVVHVRAVMDSAGSERAALITTLGGGVMGLVFAAVHPDRLRALVVVDGWARALADVDYPIGLSPKEVARRVEQSETGWGQGMMLDQFAPSMRAVPGLRQAWARYERFAASPGVAHAMIANLLELDVRHVLPAIHVPTLVVSHRDAPFGGRFGEYIAAHVEGARFVELPGIDNLMWAGDQSSILGEIEAFVTGARPVQRSDRRLATVMFTDIVDSTRHAAELGDQRWRELLERHNEIAHAEIDSFQGQFIKDTGDGLLATFDGPTRAVLCATALAERMPQIGVDIRSGLHTGECVRRHEDIGGIAVHIAARIASQATAGEVLVSNTVKELVYGSGISFEDRGAHDLRGVPGEWRLFAPAGYHDPVEDALTAAQQF